MSPEALHARQRCLFMTLVDTNVIPLKHVIFCGLFISMQISRLILFPFNTQLIQVQYFYSQKLFKSSQLAKWIGSANWSVFRMSSKKYSFISIWRRSWKLKVSTSWKQLIIRHVLLKRPWKNIRRITQYGLKDLNFHEIVMTELIGWW